MIRSITLRNFKSFGEAQTVPLEPITVLVGPNNSGKSNFMSVGRFMKNAQQSLGDAITLEGGRKELTHRPPQGDGTIEVSWTDDDSAPQLLSIVPAEEG